MPITSDLHVLDLLSENSSGVSTIFLADSEAYQTERQFEELWHK